MTAVKKKTKIYNIRPAMRKQIAILDRAGNVAAGAFSCKDEAMRAYSGILNGPNPRRVSLGHPEFAYWTKAETVERNAEKFQRMINRLERRIGLEERTKTFVPKEAGRSENTACFIVRTHKYWVMHPIHLSAFFVTMCLTENMKMNEGFKAFSRRIIKEGKTKEAKYFRDANRSGTLNNLMNGKLPAHGKKAAKPNWRGYSYGTGFASYTPRRDRDYRQVAIMG